MDSLLLTLTLIAFGLVLILISYQRHRYRRHRSALMHGVTGLSLIVCAVLYWEFILNVRSYQSIDNHAPVAELSLSKQGKTYQASLMRIPSGDLQVFTLSGNLWQIKVRLLHWHSPMTLFGLNEQLRLEYVLSQEKTRDEIKTSQFQLSHDAGFRLAGWEPGPTAKQRWLTTEVIESDPVPLADDERYHIYVRAGVVQVERINRAERKTLKAPGATPVLNSKAIDLLKNSDLSIPPTQPPGPSASAAHGQAAHSATSKSTP